MDIRALLVLTALIFGALAPATVKAQEVTGVIRVAGGGAIEITRQWLHLFGVTGLYDHQLCDADGVPWECGVAALGWSAEVTSGRRYDCTFQELPGDTRKWATCVEVDAQTGAPIGEWESVNQQFVRSGWALANPEQTGEFTGDEKIAQESGAGFWRLGGPPQTPAPADTVSGPAFVVDGNLLDIGGVLVRLYGSDAPELRQYCFLQRRFECGYSARSHLAELIRGNEVHCELVPGPRVSGHCRLMGTSDGPTLAEQMVADGWAVTDRRISQDFAEVELDARRENRGMWVSTFIRPSQWRTGQR